MDETGCLQGLHYSPGSVSFEFSSIKVCFTHPKGQCVNDQMGLRAAQPKDLTGEMVSFPVSETINPPKVNQVILCASEIITILEVIRSEVLQPGLTFEHPGSI